LALLLAGGVVPAVFAQVAFLAAVVDLGGDAGAIGDQLSCSRSLFVALALSR
jgi:hypothetical protein